MRNFRLYALGAVAVFGLGMWGWFELDLKLNYVAVTATVVTTDQTCHLEKEDNNIVTKRKTTTNEVPCGLAQDAVDHDAEYRDFKIVPRTTIHYAYVSPVDHASHLGDTWREGPTDKWPQPGAHIPVYASKTRAAESKYVTR